MSNAALIATYRIESHYSVGNGYETAFHYLLQLRNEFPDDKFQLTWDGEHMYLWRTTDGPIAAERVQRSGYETFATLDEYYSCKYGV